VQSSNPQLESRVFSSFAELEAERTRWDEFAASAGAPIYMSFDWCRLWWEFYGRRRDLAIFFVLSDGQLVGLIPMFIDSFGHWPLNIRIARLVGVTDGPTKIFDPPVRRDLAHVVLRTVIDTLLHEKMCDVISFGPMRSEHPGLAALVQSIGKESYRIQIRPAGTVTHFDLTKQPEDYLLTLGANEQKRRRYDFRYLARHGAKETVVIGPASEIADEFREFVKMHTANWESKGRLGHFRAWPRAYEYHLALAKCLSTLNRLRLFKIEVDQKAICYDYGYIFGRSFFWELPARSLDKKWLKISLGSCALISMLRRLAPERVTCLYAGVGRYEYKARLGAEESRVATARIFSRNRQKRAKIVAFYLVVSVLELLYFKIWYMRIQPRLPRFLHWPIWKFWSRIAT
jgi:CelD/BcsL family acetyltransferase involved in cellulose biosynthesis